MKPLITVLLASYNRIDLLRKTVDSCLNQSSDRFDVLIVDDGSEVDVIDYLKSLEKSEEKVSVYLQENSGVGSARQEGLMRSKGSYVLILDSDDLLEVDALLLVEKYILANPDVDFFYSNNKEVYPNGDIRYSSYKSFEKNSDFLKSIYRYPRIPYKHSGSIIKKDELIEIGGYDRNLTSKIDIDMISRSLVNGFKFLLIEEPIVSFYFHKDSISRKKRLTGLPIWWMIIKKYHKKQGLEVFLSKSIRTFFEVLKYIFERVKFFR